MENVMEAAAALADHAPPLHREVVVGDLAGGDGVAADLGDRRDVTVLGVEVDKEEVDVAPAARGGGRAGGDNDVADGAWRLEGWLKSLDLSQVVAKACQARLSGLP